MDYARQLNTQSIYNAIKHAERISGFERYALPASIWRRFDWLKQNISPGPCYPSAI